MEPFMIEQEHEYHPTITELSAMGYGNPDAAISYEKKRTSGELPPEVDEAAQEFIKSGEGLVAVQEQDDGCIDGRPTGALYLLNSSELTDLTPTEGSSHERAKVAGGGYFTGQAIRLGVGVRGVSMDADLAALGTDFSEKSIYCGAHSGAHQHGEGTDCGANDKFVPILKNALVFKDQLAQTTEGLLGLIDVPFNQEAFDSVIEHWGEALNDETYFADSTGASRLETVLEVQAAAAEGEANLPAVTKHLEGDHQEAYIAVNFVEGTTLSQGALLQTLRKEFPGIADEMLPQAFVVDAWRVAELASAASDDMHATEALYAGVVYQLATAATLTDGSLKVIAYTAA